MRRTIVELSLMGVVAVQLSACSRDSRIPMATLEALAERPPTDQVETLLGRPRKIDDDDRLVWHYIWRRQETGMCIFDVYFGSSLKVEAFSLIDAAPSIGQNGIMIEWPRQALVYPSETKCLKR